MVTDKNYYMNGFLLNALMLLVQRFNKKQDLWIIFDGDEGSGKTTLSIEVAYVLASLLGRKFDHTHVFFDVDKLIKFAQTTSEQVIIWDEAALGGLSTEWFNSSQKHLLQLAMTGRKKGHVIILNIPKINRLNSYLVNRAYCLLHTYIRKGTEIGYFTFHSKGQKDVIYDYWKKKYRGFYFDKKLKKFHGDFQDDAGKIIDIEAYNRMKDKAIASIGTSKKDENKKWKKAIDKYKKMLYIASVNMKNINNQEELAKLLNVSKKSLQRWGKLGDDNTNGGV